MALSLEQYADLVATTLKEFQRGDWTDIVTDTQEYIALPQIIKKKRVSFGSGVGWQFEVRVGSNSPAANKLINETDDVTTADMFVYATGNYRYTTTYWSANEIELKANRTPARLVDLLKAKKYDAMLSLADKMEANWWGKPADSNDLRSPRGVKYWIVTNASEGFTGGHPSGFSDVGGISRTTYARWKNYAATYVTINKTDLVRKLRRAMTFTNFKPPVDFPDLSKGSPKWELFTNYAVIRPMEEILESQNDDLGNDVASKDGMVMVRRQPLKWAPYLEADTTNPIYGINWNTWKIYFMEGEYMHDSEVMRMPNQHRQIGQFTDLVYDFACTNPRMNFVMSA